MNGVVVVVVVIPKLRAGVDFLYKILFSSDSAHCCCGNAGFCCS